jgi:hypothetical protein
MLEEEQVHNRYTMTSSGTNEIVGQQCSDHNTNQASEDDQALDHKSIDHISDQFIHGLPTHSTSDIIELQEEEFDQSPIAKRNIVEMDNETFELLSEEITPASQQVAIQSNIFESVQAGEQIHPRGDNMMNAVVRTTNSDISRTQRNPVSAMSNEFANVQQNASIGGGFNTGLHQLPGAHIWQPMMDISYKEIDELRQDNSKQANIIKKLIDENNELKRTISEQHAREGIEERLQQCEKKLALEQSSNNLAQAEISSLRRQLSTMHDVQRRSKERIEDLEYSVSSRRSDAIHQVLKSSDSERSSQQESGGALGMNRLQSD